MVAPSLRATANLFTSSSPQASLAVAQDTYVLDIVRNAESYAIALSTPLSAISLRDTSTLVEKHHWAAHVSASNNSGIVQLKAVSEGTSLMSCGSDGLVHQWDPRTRHGSVVAMKAPDRRAILAFDCTTDGILVAGGSERKSEEAQILFWDVRSPLQVIRTHSSTHSDDVTSLLFDPTSTTLLSASTDGLICSSNPLENDEDEAVSFVANWGTSVAKLGLLQDRIWTCSDMETFAIWNLELDGINDYGDVRTPKATLPISSANSSREWRMDYVVDVARPRSLSEAPFLLGGTNAGSVGLVDFMSGNDQLSQWKLEGVVSGHEGVVRSAMWDEQRQVLVTGGEDSRLNIWRIREEDGMEVDQSSTPPSMLARKRELSDDSKILADETSRGKKSRV